MDASSVMDDRRPTRLRRAAIRLGSLFVAVVVLGWLLDIPGWLESRMMYYPSRDLFVTPPGVEEVWFETGDGVRLHAWFMPATDASTDHPAPAVLHVHGNAGNVASHADFSSFLPQRGVSVLLFDYRSYGRSDSPGGILRRKHLLRDADAALDALLNRDDVDPERVGVFGVSLGGVVGLALAERRLEVRSVVSVAAFSSYPDIASHHLGLLGRALAKPGMAASKSAAQLGKRDLLILHGALDDIVPASHAHEIHESASRAGVPSRLVISEDAGHNDILIMEPDEQETVVDFFLETLSSPAAAPPG